MEELTIGAVAQQAGVRPSTIRYYESVGLLPLPRRVSGQRRYEPETLTRVAFILKAQRLGFTLAQIKALFEQQEAATPLSANWQSLAHQKLSEVDQLIQQATKMRRLLLAGLRCDCPNLADCMDCVLAICAE